MSDMKPHLKRFGGEWNCGTRRRMSRGFALCGFVSGPTIWHAYMRWMNRQRYIREDV